MAIVWRLALGRLFSLSGGSAAYVALIATIFGRTGSALWVSAAILAGVAASVASAPFAGWVADHFDRRTVLITSDLSAAAISLAMAAAAHVTVALVVLVGLSSVAQAPFEPASAAAVPHLVAEPAVPRANSLLAVMSSAGYLAGPFLGGLLLSVGVPAPALFVADAATFVVSAALVAGIGQSFGRGSTHEHPGPLAGLTLIVGNRGLRLAVAASTVSLMGVGMVDVASYPLSRILGGGTTGYGAMTALLGGGGLVGAALAGRALRGEPSGVLVAGVAAGAAGIALAGLAPVLVIALASMAVAGAGRGLADVTTVTIIQARAPDEVRSRVFAAQDGAAHAAFSVSALLGGLLVQSAGPRGAFAAAAACGVGAAVLAVSYRRGAAPGLPADDGPGQEPGPQPARPPSST